MAFEPTANLDDLWSGEMISVAVGERRILLVHQDGAVQAYEDRCAHMGVPLSQGRLERGVLTCPAHHWEYDPATGCGLNPRTARLVTFPVRIEGSEILVDVDRPGADPEPCRAPATGALHDPSGRRRTGPAGSPDGCRMGASPAGRRPTQRAGSSGHDGVHPAPNGEVGPVLTAGTAADAVIAAIQDLNRNVRIVDRGSYVRVHAPVRCFVTRQAIEARLGRTFLLPADLESIMPSMRGVFEVSRERADWSLPGGLEDRDGAP